MFDTDEVCVWGEGEDERGGELVRIKFKSAG